MNILLITPPENTTELIESLSEQHPEQVSVVTDNNISSAFRYNNSEVDLAFNIEEPEVVVYGSLNSPFTLDEIIQQSDLHRVRKLIIVDTDSELTNHNGLEIITVSSSELNSMLIF